MPEKETDLSPGAMLTKALKKAGMTQKELALRADISEKYVSQIINGSKNISATLAHKLDIALGSRKGYWFDVQTKYDEKMIALEEKCGITTEEIGILKNLREIFDCFVKEGKMKNDGADAVKVLKWREILCVNNLTSIPKISYSGAYRAQVSSSTSIDPYVLFAWQRLCEITTEKITLNCDFSPEKLKQNLGALKQLMFDMEHDDFTAKLAKIFAECGIAFAVVKNFRGAPVQGFIKQTDNGKVILCLTIRGKGADRFWFSLFHEIGHLLNGDLNVRFVDFSSLRSDIEDKADCFARDTLIDPQKYRAFVARRDFKFDEICHFSQSIGVPEWITIGRLHSDEWLDWSFFANKIPKLSWVD